MDIFLQQAHPEWHDLLHRALKKMDEVYLSSLSKNSNQWLPGPSLIFKAFSEPLSKANYILLGESPYPRAESANGLAFWDGAVKEIWSDTGLSKPLNRATSLRNFIKMLLKARGDLSTDFSQDAIATLDKTNYVQTLPELFRQLIEQGFILLNASLVYQKNLVRQHAKYWQPFMEELFLGIHEIKPSLKLVLFGKIAEKIAFVDMFSGLIAEHPYNVSFITNDKVLEFFKPLDLLSKNEY